MSGMQPCRSTENGASALACLGQSPDSVRYISQEAGLGLQDRDYMHTGRNGRARRRRPQAFRSLLWALCGAMFIAVVLMRTNDWWIARQQAGPGGTRQRARIVAPPAPPPTDVIANPLEEGPAQRASPRPAGAAPSHYRPQTQTQVVYKCVVNGRVTYSGPDECKSGRASILEIRLGPGPGPGPGPDSGAPRTPRIAAQREASRLAEQPMAQQLQAAADEAAQVVARAHEQQLAASRRAECLRLDDIVRNLDSQARQPSSGQTQDWIRSQRTDARNRQFALRC